MIRWLVVACLAVGCRGNPLMPADPNVGGADWGVRPGMDRRASNDDGPPTWDGKGLGSSALEPGAVIDEGREHLVRRVTMADRRSEAARRVSDVERRQRSIASLPHEWSVAELNIRMTFCFLMKHDCLAAADRRTGNRVARRDEQGRTLDERVCDECASECMNAVSDLAEWDPWKGWVGLVVDGVYTVYECYRTSNADRWDILPDNGSREWDTGPATWGGREHPNVNDPDYDPDDWEFDSAGNIVGPRRE